jgi:Zn finger protein HypA/HybF involved in hydrogenase expression
MSLVEPAKRTVGPESVVPIYLQKYLLQRRTTRGFLVKVKTFEQPVSPEQALEEFGPGYYVLKATKPRFKTIWKQSLGDIEETQSDKELQSLKKRTGYLTYGVVGLGVTEAIGFGLTHRRFSGLEEKLEKMKMLVQTRLKPEGLQCGNCGKPLDFLLQDFCSQCGMQIEWPSRILLTQPREMTSECLNCRWPLLTHQVYCPHCGHQRPILISTESKSTWTPVSTATSR